MDAEAPINEAPEDPTKAPELDSIANGSAAADTVTNAPVSPEAELWLTYEEIMYVLPNYSLR